METEIPTPDLPLIKKTYLGHRFLNSPVILVQEYEPLWDGTRVLFEIASGAVCIPCAISRAALNELSGERHRGPLAFMNAFLVMRDRIEVIVRDKLSEMPGGLSGLVGTLNIWVSDLDDLPPSGVSAAHQGFTQRLGA